MLNAGGMVLGTQGGSTGGTWDRGEHWGYLGYMGQ